MARTLPVIAAGTMLVLCTEALFGPFCCCAGFGRKTPWWSGWHHHALAAFAMLVALAGATRVDE